MLGMEKKRINNVLEVEPINGHFPFLPTHGTRTYFFLLVTITCHKMPFAFPEC